MRTLNRIFPVAALVSAALFQACGEPPVDNSRADTRLFPVKGVIRGTVSYQGPHPCSRDGHIVGAALLLVFDRRNPPPPNGLANTAVNFGVVTGDVLFKDEPRTPSTTLDCPKDRGVTETITASAPFTIAPMDPGSYIIQAFYDYYGDFFPTFKTRNLPLAGDVGGGDIDVVDALQHASDPNFIPKFLPIDVGIPRPLPANAPPGTVPTFDLPDSGFVRDNVTVTMAAQFAYPRPYFYVGNPGRDGSDPVTPETVSDFADDSSHPGTADGKLFDGSGNPEAPKNHFGDKETDPNYVPVATMTQDWQVYAPPTPPTQNGADMQQASFIQIDLKAGVPQAEQGIATALPQPNSPPPYPPFHFQLPSATDATKDFLLAWDSGKKIPETRLVPQMWPLVVFAKLVDDFPGQAPHTRDPNATIAQGSDTQSLNSQLLQTEPVVIIQGLTVFNDSLFATTGLGGPAPPKTPADAAAHVDHVRVLVRPSVVCFNPNHIENGGLLVTPHQQGINPADPNLMAKVDIISFADVQAASGGPPPGGLLREVKFACLPKGRYQVNAVYPTSQAWTTPNEAGGCYGSEGSTDYNDLMNPTCTKKPRPVLYSQGPRAIIEIVDAKDPSFCTGAAAVPDECLPCDQRQNKNSDECKP